MMVRRLYLTSLSFYIALFYLNLLWKALRLILGGKIGKFILKRKIGGGFVRVPAPDFR